MPLWDRTVILEWNDMLLSVNPTCHPAEVTFPPLPQPIKAGTVGLDLAMPKGCKAELT